jgi:hypothetical protein
MSASFDEFSTGAMHGRFGQIGDQEGKSNNNIKFVGLGGDTAKYGEEGANDDPAENQFAANAHSKLAYSGTS